MSTINVLQTNQRYMTWFGIYSHQVNEPTNEFFKRPLPYYLQTVNALALIASWMYFMNNRSSDFKTAMGGIKITFALVQCGGVYFNLGYKMINMKAMHLKLQETVDAGVGEGYRIYWENEQRCRTYTRNICSFIFFHVSAFMLVLIPVIYHIYRGEYDTTNWNLFFYMVVPFDQTHVPGYLLMWLFQFNTAFFYVSTMTTLTSYFASCCFYIDAMCNYFGYLIRSINEDLKQNTDENRLKLKVSIDKLSQLIKFHVDIFELANINGGSILALLPVNCIFMAISIYDVEHYIKNFEPSHLLFDVSCIVCSLSWPSLMCYFASLATDKIASLGDVAYGSDWDKYPLSIRKYIILIIARSQEPVYFTGMNLVNCTLEVLGKLCKTGGSCYLMFRTLEQRR
ncbi:odorant receptor 67c-like isoform X2 [Contarinia nasturtii]|uniref:odorant receptor 67c-like isoform X2 n=1 Tax=Contarinia nasturtii TaxID=265458 RepID=UPI0012D48F45|nr:odorant receptor 67c-like isoform X2 [Contarinia nasturtii]